MNLLSYFFLIFSTKYPPFHSIIRFYPISNCCIHQTSSRLCHNFQFQWYANYFVCRIPLPLKKHLWIERWNLDRKLENFCFSIHLILLSNFRTREGKKRNHQPCNFSSSLNLIATKFTFDVSDLIIIIIITPVSRSLILIRRK